MRHFITGLFGTGKTTHAKKLAQAKGAQYIDFDDAWVYQEQNSPEKCLRFLDALPDDCTVDAIPYDPTWETFNSWAEGKDARVTVMCCSEAAWRERNSGRKPEHPCTHEQWLGFWLNVMPSLTSEPCEFYDTESMQVISREELLKGMGYRDMLLDNLKASPKGYDWKYQSIDEVGVIGYAPCADTWNRIRPLAEWRGASVVDMGCNHAYMLWRAEEAGATTAIGLDESQTVIYTAASIRFMRGSNATLSVWNAGEPVPEADVTLCLNMLHHVPDPAATIGQVRSPVLILESPAKGDAGQDLVGAMRAHYANVSTHESSRPRRAIYRCRR